MPNIFSSVLFFRKPSCNDDVTGGGPREAPIAIPVLKITEQNTYT